ncbi:MAG: BRCT domain-containing protein [Bradymonadales bacterium]|nr:BRCT domain-containing protein [Bradymonadales bacterium]
MPLYASDIYSGFVADAIGIVGSKDVTRLEHYLRLGEFSQSALGLPEALMRDWQRGIEQLIIDPPRQITTTEQAIALLMMLRDAGQRRFRIITQAPQPEIFTPIFAHLGHEAFAKDFVHSEIAAFSSPFDDVDWGFLDISQIEALLHDAIGNDSFKQTKTAVIAGRLSNMARSDAEHALIDVGIETQNSISHNIDYLILGSKGTGGSKQDKVNNLKNAGRDITILGENGFDKLLRAPKAPPDDWPVADKNTYEDIVRSLRHVWAFELDLYCLVYQYDPEENTL